MTHSIGYDLWRQRLDDGGMTTLYATRHPRASTRLRVVHFDRPERLDVWCRSAGVDEAIVGGFFVRDPYRPLGEVRIGGRELAHERVPDPFAERRGCVLSDDGAVAIVPRNAAGERPGGDLLQAGPLLVSDGAVAFDSAADAEGFSAASEQFDSDITAERHPRAALGIGDEELIALTCDGRRTGVDAGLSMLELAGVMAQLGARHAINLDGGGSTTHVHCGHLLNRPYSDQDQPGPQSRPIVTALALEAV